MIAGKTETEILSMKCITRYRWYKIILPKEKEEAMRVVKIATKSKLRSSWTPERRSKLSDSNRGENNPMKRPEISAKFKGENNPMRQPDIIAKCSSKNHHMYGKILPKETCDKISVSLTGRILTTEHRYKISKANVGKNNPMYGRSVIHTEESKSKMSASKTGKNNPMYGKVRTEEWKTKHSECMSGENHWNWQNGKSFEPYGIDFNDELRERIRERDNYICQKCSITQEESISKYNKILSVHHIDYDKMNNNSENLISLCTSCHSKTNYNREDWIEYFRKNRYI